MNFFMNIGSNDTFSKFEITLKLGACAGKKKLENWPKINVCICTFHASMLW